ncbi:MAG: HAMP domain-containing sensor histidine kinase [Candidatus Omnitrophota bacterium]
MKKADNSGERIRRSADSLDVSRQFARVLAHDLNNLLTGIMGFSMLILEDMDENNEFYSYMKEIEKSSIKCRDLTDKLISFSSEITLGRCKTDIKKAIETGVEKAKDILTMDAEMITNFGETSLADLDADKISHIIVCILADAEYRSTKISKIDISSEEIQVDRGYLERHSGINRKGKYILVKLGINGMTLSDEDKKHLFDPKFKTGKKILLGCELAVVREIVEKHGGMISATPRNDKTVVFEILLPVEGQY